MQSSRKGRVRKVCRRRRGREGGRAARRVEGEREDRAGSFMMVPAVLGLPCPSVSPVCGWERKRGREVGVRILCMA